MISVAIEIVEEVLTHSPEVIAAVRGFFAGNAGATDAELADKLKSTKKSQAVEDSEWTKDLDSPADAG